MRKWLLLKRIINIRKTVNLRIIISCLKPSNYEQIIGVRQEYLKLYYCANEWLLLKGIDNYNIYIYIYI